MGAGAGGPAFRSEGTHLLRSELPRRNDQRDTDQDHRPREQAQQVHLGRNAYPTVAKRFSRATFTARETGLYADSTRIELTFPRGGAAATERLRGWVRAERERWKKRGQET